MNFWWRLAQKKRKLRQGGGKGPGIGGGGGDHTVNTPLPPGVSLTAPVLTWVSAADDNTPLFEAIFTDLEVDDVGRLQIDNDIAFGSPIEATNTADAAEVLALQLDYTSGALADGQWWARVRHERGASVSDWSNVETETIAASSFTPTFHIYGF